MAHRGLQRSLAGGQPAARGIVLLAFFLLLTSASCQQPSPDTSSPDTRHLPHGYGQRAGQCCRA